MRRALLALLLLLVAHGAMAGAREEAGARQALRAAQTQHQQHHYDRAYKLLATAEKACEPDKCAPGVLAQLLRDMGTMQLLDGDEDGARNNFSAALTFDPAIELNPAYAVRDVKAIWDSVKSPTDGGSEQPTGDFQHTPPTEQKKDVPLPLYVEYHGSAHPAQVVVRYQGAAMTSYKRVKLERVGSGWGTVVPCGAVKVGAFRYFFQGFDSEGLPILDGGDKRHPYTVPIRQSITSPLPHLPGRRAPTTCGEGMETDESETTPTPEGEGTHEKETPTTPTGPTDERVYAHVWIGVSGSMDFTVLPGGTDVCTRNADGSSTDANWACTSDTPEGSDFPNTKTENASLVAGKAGEVSSGIQPGNVRVKLTFDYAITQNFLIGVAVGYVAGAYTGTILPHFIPMHLEAHASWLFGTNPLSHVGFSPYLQAAAGVGEYDSNLTMIVTQSNIPGARPVQGWHVGGPGFVAIEAGVRFTFSPRIGFWIGARGTLAFGTAVFPAFGPTLNLQVGF